MKLKSAYLLIMLCLAAPYSCTQNEICTQTMLSEVHVGFYGIVVEEDDDEDEMERRSVYMLHATGEGLDSLINADTTGVSAIDLQLSEQSDSCAFLFRFSIVVDTIITYLVRDTIIENGSVPDSISIITTDSLLMYSFPDTLSTKTQYITVDVSDTLRFYYTRELTFVSTPCGFMYNYRLSDIKYTHNYIDTIFIIDPYISTLDDENIQILLYNPAR